MHAILVLGPSGAGKSTLCETLCQVYSSLQISSLTINLDCANLTSPATISITELITLEDIMQEYEIGPNASLLFSFDFLLANISWLHKAIVDCRQNTTLLIIDLPGQSELYLSHPSLKLVINDILKTHSISGVVLELFDSTHIQELPHFISLCIMALSTVVNMELPHISLLTKVDLIRTSPLGILNQYLSLPSAQSIVQDLLPIECSHLCKNDPKYHKEHHFEQAMKQKNANSSHQMQNQLKSKKRIKTKNNKLLPILAKIIDQHSVVSFVPCSIYMPQLISFLIYTIEVVFGTQQMTHQNNKKYAQFTKDCRVSFAMERLINNLEAKLFKEQE